MLWNSRSYKQAGFGLGYLSSDIGRTNESRVMAANRRPGLHRAGPHDIIQGEFGFLRVFCNEWDMKPSLPAVWARRS